jgi:hypothetical protein
LDPAAVKELLGRRVYVFWVKFLLTPMWSPVGIQEPVIRRCMPILPFREHMLMWLKSLPISLESRSKTISKLLP